MKFKHFIITRFNLPLWPTGEKDPIKNLSYLEYRMSLFEKYTYPSIKQQTCQNFNWLCLFDINTPLQIKKRLEELNKEYNNFIPYYLDITKYKDIPQEIIEQRKKYDKINSTIHVEEVKRDDKEYVENIQRLVTPAFLQDCIKPLVDSDTDYIFTTRIDNDDVIHKEFIKNIQESYKNNPGEYVINFPKGCQSLLNDKLLFTNKFYNNHFTTLCEKNDKSFVSIIFYNHLLLCAHKKIENVDTSIPMFIELIHGGNVCNSLTLDKDLHISFGGIKLSDFAPEMFAMNVFNTVSKMIVKYNGVALYLLKNKLGLNK